MLFTAEYLYEFVVVFFYYYFFVVFEILTFSPHAQLFKWFYFNYQIGYGLLVNLLNFQYLFNELNEMLFQLNRKECNTNRLLTIGIPSRLIWYEPYTPSIHCPSIYIYIYIESIRWQCPIYHHQVQLVFILYRKKVKKLWMQIDCICGLNAIAHLILLNRIWSRMSSLFTGSICIVFEFVVFCNY